jgi:membrane protease YdiL (CAAX protease family)
LGWAIYLLGDEFLFRGILFFSGIDILPLWLNITINCILYAVAHLPKGKLEIIASLPFGVVLCLISYYTGNFWAAWLIHLTLALSNSLIAIKANPLMQFDFKKI